MACYHPLKGWRKRVRNPSGKCGITFNLRDGWVDKPIEVPCGQCIGCKLERSRQWAIRCVHEASLYERNCFLTLTYNETNVPENGSLNKKHFQDFMKRLRFSKQNLKIRFFHCGEYGERFLRPHYHACLFNYDFPDKIIHKISNEQKLYVSQELNDIWGHGFCIIGDVTFDSAAYVARYITKKITGKNAASHYEKTDYLTGEITDRQPEYVTMSRRPGIGRGWYDQYHGDVFPHDFVISKEKKYSVPKYYGQIFEVQDPEKYAEVKGARRLSAKNNLDDCTADRLRVRETVKQQQALKLIRKFEL